MTREPRAPLDLPLEAFQAAWSEYDFQDRFAPLLALIGERRYRSPQHLADVLTGASTRPEAPEVLVLARAFYRARRAVAEAVDAPLKAIRPDTPLTALFDSTSKGRVAWELVHRRLRSPGLGPFIRPPWFEALSALLALVPAVLVIVLGLASPIPFALGFPLMVGCSLGWAWLIITVTSGTPLEYLPGTVGEIARVMVVTGADALALPIDQLSRAQLVEVVREIVMQYEPSGD